MNRSNAPASVFLLACFDRFRRFIDRRAFGTDRRAFGVGRCAFGIGCGASGIAAIVLALAPLHAPPANAQPRRVQSPAAAAPSPAPDFASRPEVDHFVADMVSRHEFLEHELRSMFAEVRRDDSVIRLMTPAPPGFRKSWQSYRSRFLDPVRIREGLRFWHENESWLTLASALYGVPPEIVVAIIGVETLYGRYPGNVRVIDALCTLAFDYPRRAEYFRSELEQFLLYARDEGLDVFSVRGSFAGAIGLPQFMPGSIRRYAVDLDGDSAIDLRGNTADAIGSVANFLAQHGWRTGEPVRFRTVYDREDRLDPLIAAGIRPQFTIGQLADYGVSSVDPVETDMPLALIDLPNGDDTTTYYLGAQNFFVITRYNRSSFYAMAVYDLSRALAERR